MSSTGTSSRTGTRNSTGKDNAGQEKAGHASTGKDSTGKDSTGQENAGRGERVQKALARMGHGSRREIERLIDVGKVRINGQLARAGDHVVVGDKINIGNKRIEITGEVRRIRVLAYNKPEGEVCTRKDEQDRPTVFQSIGRIHDGRWIVIGRLDINSTGLLLFTNYGELANHLMHPSNEVEREYAVRVQGEVTPEMIRTLLKGVELEDGVARFDQVIDAGGQGSNRWYHVILREGKNREVRRLWQSQDVRVSRLIRVRYANLNLPRNLRQGQKYELNLEEVKALFEVVNLPWPREASTDKQAKANKRKAKDAKWSSRYKGKKPGARKGAGSSSSSRSVSGPTSGPVGGNKSREHRGKSTGKVSAKSTSKATSKAAGKVTSKAAGKVTSQATGKTKGASNKGVPGKGTAKGTSRGKVTGKP